MLADGNSVISANAILVWIVQGLCFGFGFSLMAWPFRRWVP